MRESFGIRRGVDAIAVHRAIRGNESHPHAEETGFAGGADRGFLQHLRAGMSFCLSYRSSVGGLKSAGKLKLALPALSPRRFAAGDMDAQRRSSKSGTAMLHLTS